MVSSIDTPLLTQCKHDWCWLISVHGHPPWLWVEKAWRPRDGSIVDFLSEIITCLNHFNHHWVVGYILTSVKSLVKRIWWAWFNILFNYKLSLPHWKLQSWSFWCLMHFCLPKMIAGQKMRTIHMTALLTVYFDHRLVNRSGHIYTLSQSRGSPVRSVP